jgi:hypothetical protein
MKTRGIYKRERERERRGDLLGGRDCLSFSALAASLMTKVYK